MVFLAFFFFLLCYAWLFTIVGYSVVYCCFIFTFHFSLRKHAKQIWLPCLLYSQMIVFFYKVAVINAALKWVCWIWHGRRVVSWGEFEHALQPSEWCVVNIKVCLARRWRGGIVTYDYCFCVFEFWWFYWNKIKMNANFMMRCFIWMFFAATTINSEIDWPMKIFEIWND